MNKDDLNFLNEICVNIIEMNSALWLLMEFKDCYIVIA